jgi:phosphopantothenoylcysteine decarboxylase/phosphopantothenate--cysteine ligase
MARILITSGPTRQYLDPVRYLTNASSGRMGQALAEAAIHAGHDAVIVSGPVEVTYPEAAEVIPVVSTDDMLVACRQVFPGCHGLIGVAAPCDYRPVRVEPRKIHKTGEPLVLHLEETVDIVACLAAQRDRQWIVGFALETEDHRLRALAKLERKSCDLVVVNGVDAMHALETRVEVIDRSGRVIGAFAGAKRLVAGEIFSVIQRCLIDAE